MLRIGPLAHGECRKGGFPFWLLNSPFSLCCNNPDYLAKVKIRYETIYEQVKGLMYCEGGNIIGIQLENELVAVGAENVLALFLEHNNIRIQCKAKLPSQKLTPPALQKLSLNKSRWQKPAPPTQALQHRVYLQKPQTASRKPPDLWVGSSPIQP